jgi:carbon storage regulator
VIVIPRKKGESVVFGDDIILTVIEIKGDKVRLGVEHPKEVTVHRREVYEAILSPRGSSSYVTDAPSLTLVLERVGSDDAPA